MYSFNQSECLGCGQPCDGYYCYPCTCQQCGVGLTNGICFHCTYGNGQPIPCCKCEGPLRGRFCLFRASRAETSFANDPNPNSFNDFQNLSSPQPQCETYLCKLCGNDLHYGYACPPQYPFRNAKGFIASLGDFFEIQHAQPEETNELLQKLLEDLQIISEKFAEYMSSPRWNRPTFYNNDEEHSIQYKEYLENSSNAITPVLPTEEPECSLSMGNEHLSTIPEIESDKLIKSSVKNLVPIPSESEVTSDNENTLFDSSPKFDYLEEFSGELMPTSIINKERIKREHEEYISLMKKLLTINSFSRPLENFHANTIIETFPTSSIPIEDSDSIKEEIDIFTDTDDLMPPDIESDDYDS
nr:hypothetical protein [Tanacetum cinerariifolium]